MKLVFTERAIEKLNEKMAGKNTKYLKLKYDTEGCGCVVSGVAALWLVDEKSDGDIVLKTNDREVLIEKTKMVFFDEDMTIDIVESANCFLLKSPNQILNPRMMLSEKSGTGYEIKA